MISELQKLVIHIKFRIPDLRPDPKSHHSENRQNFTIDLRRFFHFGLNVFGNPILSAIFNKNLKKVPPNPCHLLKNLKHKKKIKMPKILHLY
jgi:hypothetical protein